MTKMQELLGRILNNRINAELTKDKQGQNFVSIQETMDIFLAGDKITAEQYADFTALIVPVDNTATTNSFETNATTS
ncbi:MULTISPECIES: hypothetical protein [Clostridium]|uniref:hypothetical protein n=1 Tax=Clostridium TaxID=1485 RepID=UPI00041A0C39|nr:MULTISPECIES: hypothetical protein [Clostridium]MBN7573663.1 hypothetical protein [Clostridium beijerinckii]MBN7578923.1 hypothetical protein [Clostridium beijerinckii]MBN7583294.1 hypothetical protein [Clostridium beijerinckii]MBO0521228.1 hypothetical protein [Clostridium beijerinckii]MZK52620.1 hypothetical protein [Clostridium beijerinckii]